MHTPGPWIATNDGPSQDGDGKYQQWYVRNDEINHPVCQVFHVTKQGEANAKLIAAAPELLEAAEEVMDMYKDDSMFRHPSNSPAIKALRAAIAKAKQ